MKFRLSLFIRGALIVVLNSANLSARTYESSAKDSTVSQNSQQSQLTNNHQSYYLQDEIGHSIEPSNMVQVEDDLYFLGLNCLWFCRGAKLTKTGHEALILERIAPPPGHNLKVPPQEFNDFIYLPLRKSLVILDKSGDLFEFVPTNKHWQVYKANCSNTGSPDPDYVSLCLMTRGIALLDPERNQIWRLTGPRRPFIPSFKEVLPWRTKTGEINIANGIALAYDHKIYLLRRNGRITTFSDLRPISVASHLVIGAELKFKIPPSFRPSRLCSSIGKPLYVVERENNRVLKIDKVTGNSDLFIFSIEDDLRGLIPSKAGFWVISGDRILYRSLVSANKDPKHWQPRLLDSRLRGFIFPVAGQSLPRHPGVYPGSRRLYRFGVHEGLDVFNLTSARVHIAIGTPVRAVHSGHIIRADLHFRDMDAKRFARLMQECQHEHFTSPRNEDLFRGCQVWLDHGHGLITRYAHLNQVNPLLKVGMSVDQGELLGYVGVSGTGQNLPGRAKYPHLHFEIWLDGKYLGSGLNPQETIGIFEDIFKERIQ